MEHAAAHSLSGPRSPVRSEAPRAPSPLTREASVLRLQRTAGNRATARHLARCGAGGCSCGGRCGHGAQRDPELDERVTGQLRRAVAARRSTAA